jgi:flagellin
MAGVDLSDSTTIDFSEAGGVQFTYATADFASTVGTGIGVEIDFGFDTNDSVSLLNASNASVSFDYNGDGTMETAIGSSAVNLAKDVSLDFGNGLQYAVTGGSIAAGTLATSGFSYQRVGTWNGDVSTAANARSEMNKLDTAISTISSRLQTLGALVDRLSFKEDNLSVAKVNTEGAYSRIMDADMAIEQLDTTKFQILQQTATAMLAQANSAPQSILQLFQ